MTEGNFFRDQVDRRFALKSLLGGTLSVFVNGVEAQDAADVNAIVKELAPINGQTQSSGYVPIQREAVVMQPATIFVDVGRKVEVELYFEHGSDRITSMARKQLGTLGYALASPDLASFRYLVAGHTDAVGSSPYNLILSRRRAQAVYDHLIEQFLIDPSRLIPAGFGSSRLKRPQAPKAGVNRRVEVLLIIP